MRSMRLIRSHKMIKKIRKLMDHTENTSDHEHNDNDTDAVDAPVAVSVAVSPDQAAQLHSHAEQCRLVEALLFASAEAVPMTSLRERLPEDADLGAILADLEALYTGRGINLVRRGDAWAFRTAPDLVSALTMQVDQPRKLGRAAIETLAIIAYHQPATRGEIETIRGVAVSRGVIDTLMELGWIKPGRRRESPGRPVTWMTTPLFLDHFGLTGINDLPGLDELRATGLLDARPAVVALADQWAERGMEGLPLGDHMATRDQARADAEAQADAEAAAVEFEPVTIEDEDGEPGALPGDEPDDRDW